MYEQTAVSARKHGTHFAKHCRILPAPTGVVRTELKNDVRGSELLAEVPRRGEVCMAGNISVVRILRLQVRRLQLRGGEKNGAGWQR